MTVPSRQIEPSEALPSLLGPYRITGILGRGGMGVVYRAMHREQAAPVALKTVRAPSEMLLAGIRREIHALRRLNHPGADLTGLPPPTLTDPPSEAVTCYVLNLASFTFDKPKKQR